jgi:hypothetical protein
MDRFNATTEHATPSIHSFIQFSEISHAFPFTTASWCTDSHNYLDCLVRALMSFRDYQRMPRLMSAVFFLASAGSKQVEKIDFVLTAASASARSESRAKSVIAVI